MVTVTSQGLSTNLDKDPGNISNQAFLDPTGAMAKADVGLARTPPPARRHFEGDNEFHVVEKTTISKKHGVKTVEGVSLHYGDRYPTKDYDGSDALDVLSQVQTEASGQSTRFTRLELTDQDGVPVEDLEVYKVVASSDTIPNYIWVTKDGDKVSAQLSGPLAMTDDLGEDVTRTFETERFFKESKQAKAEREKAEKPSDAEDPDEDAAKKQAEALAARTSSTAPATAQAPAASKPTTAKAQTPAA